MFFGRAPSGPQLQKEDYMEYYRDPKNQIQADIAYRLGLISSQYSSLKNGFKTDEDYSVTLNIAILQNVLTNCMELFNAMKQKKRKKNLLGQYFQESVFWGLSEKMIIKNTFANPEKLTVGDFFRHIRNALSHPTIMDDILDFPSTGYTTILDNSDDIHKFRFVSSPDTRKNRPKILQSEKQANAFLQKEKNNGTMPGSVEIRKSEDGKLSFYKDEKPFARIFIADILADQLNPLIKGLCNYLAQPIQELWDGETIVKLIA